MENKSKAPTIHESIEVETLIAYEDIQRAGYPLEASDALDAWERGESYLAPWYMELPKSVFYEIETVNWLLLH